MADSRNIITTFSVALALLAVGWALYVSQRSAPMAGSSGGAAASEPAPAADGSVAVITATVRAQPLSSQLNALGTARSNEAVEITAKLANRVTAIRFRDGQRVQKGQVLVELDGTQARADLAAAEAALADSASQVKRTKELLATRVVSAAQYEQLEATLKANAARVDAARSMADDTVVRAPFSGTVGLRRISVGSLVNPSTTITTLDDSSVIKVDFAVPENFLSSLREGLRVLATAAAFPEREFAGVVASVDSRVDPVSRSVVVRALVPNSDGVLKPGMFLNVKLSRDARDALMIPEAALMPEQSRQFLYVVEDGRAVRREVRIGGREPGKVEVLAGLKAGDHVIVEGTQKVREGGAVRELKDQQASESAEALR
jgi:membrane fusion protein (multidrug efflux system)